MNSCTTVAALLLAIALSLNSSGAFCQEPTEVTEEQAWARPLLVVPPTFPKDAPSEMLPVEIRVEGTVTADGTFTSPVFVPSEGKQEFVQAVADVLQFWRFRPVFDRDCKIKESRVRLNVYFELKEGNPSISISSPVAKKVDRTRNAAAVPQFVRRPKPEFPPAALQAGIEGFAEICMVVDGDGEIVSKTVISSLPNALFGKAALDALSRARFSRSDMTGRPNKTVSIALPINFCIEGPVSYHDSHCHQ